MDLAGEGMLWGDQDILEQAGLGGRDVGEPAVEAMSVHSTAITLEIRLSYRHILSALNFALGTVLVRSGRTKCGWDQCQWSIEYMTWLFAVTAQGQLTCSYVVACAWTRIQQAGASTIELISWL